jgi:ribosomal protein S18 acetylase RimI-like enzyme
MPAHAYVEAPQALGSFVVRDAVAADIPDIMRLKLELAISDGIAYTVRATAADWARDGFGPGARFTIYVAETARRVIGIAICAERYFPGWVGPTVALLDICVEAHFRGHGVGTAMLQRVAQFAKARDSVMVELTMRAGNRAGRLYERTGFTQVSEIHTYVIAGGALDQLAGAAE